MKISNRIQNVLKRAAVVALPLVGAVGGGLLTLTSCEDMFTADNNLVTTDLTPQDTVYQVMGIVQRMQKLADRTVLLGEVRADLVDINPSASVDVQELSNNTVSTDNKYNNPTDYYAVINSCNIYLAHVDSLLKTHGEYYYEKEIAGVKCFRAWCYLELAKIYGEVPFVTEPVISAEAAEQIVASGQKKGMVDICTYLINDLAKYPYMSKNLELRPAYGNQSWNGMSYNNFFIPARVMLAELYLWRATFTGDRGDYINAIRLYHDFFTFPNEERSVSQISSSGLSYAHCSWSTQDREFASYPIDSYGLNIFEPARPYQNVGVIPMDSVEYFGEVSELRDIFCSQYRNKYYPEVSPSARVREISAEQDYCLYIPNSVKPDTVYGPHELNILRDNILIGDTRLYSVYYTESNLSENQFDGELATTKEVILKWSEGSSRLSTDKRNSYMPYFRINILYLHLAEALNRAGFPCTAYAVLKYGLSYETMNDPDIIPGYEFDDLAEIKSYGFTLSEPYYTGEMAEQCNGSFVIWPSNVFYQVDKKSSNSLNQYPSNAHLQIGVHSIGSGDTEFNTRYWLDDEETLSGLTEYPVIPDTVGLPKKNATAADTLAWQESLIARDEALQKYAEVYEANMEYLSSDEIVAKRKARVAELILTEEALEGMFEGTRFYDLMRYSLQENKPNYLFEAIGKRKGKVTTDSGASSLAGGNWYIPLRSR